MRLVVSDVGGTHIRFAIAHIRDQHPIELEHQATMRTSEYADVISAWAAYQEKVPAPLPRDASLAFACPTDGPVLQLTNHQWTIAKDSLPGALGLDRVLVLNDFAAVGHAVLSAPEDQLAHICGPNIPLPSRGVVSVVGPGTGLGVAQIICSESAQTVIATEAGHIGFAPADDLDDAILARLRRRFGRVSVERVVSGPSFVDIYEALAEHRGVQCQTMSDAALWSVALTGTDPLATAALDRFCLKLGAVAGDIALAQGAGGVVIAGGVGKRLAECIARSHFQAGFIDKGRFQERMGALPVKLITTPQPGLIGAANAFRTHFDAVVTKA